MCLNNSEKQLLALASLRLCIKPVVESCPGEWRPYAWRPFSHIGLNPWLNKMFVRSSCRVCKHTQERSLSKTKISTSSKGRTPPLGPSYTGDTNAVRVVWDYLCVKIDEERNVSSTQEDWDYLRSQHEVLRDGVLHITS